MKTIEFALARNGSSDELLLVILLQRQTCGRARGMNGFRFFVSEHDHEFVATNHQSALDGLYRPRVGDGIAGLVEDGTVAFDLDVV